MSRNDQELIPPLEKHKFNISNLINWMEQNNIESKGLIVQQFQGGMSNPTFFLETENHRYVLRKKPPGKLLPKAHAVDREYKVMEALGKIDFPVPRMLGFCDDPSLIGTEFFMMDYLDGRIITTPEINGFSKEERNTICISLAETLAKLHKVDYASLGLESFGRPEGYIQRQTKLWSDQFQRSKEDITVEANFKEMDLLSIWLKENSSIEDEFAIAHGDYRLGNTIIDKNNSTVIGVLDWELSTLGHPLADLGYYCIPYRYGFEELNLNELGIPSEKEFLELYMKYSGRDSIPNWPLFLSFALFRSASIIFGVAARTLLGNVSSESSNVFEQIRRAEDMARVGYDICSNS